MKSNKKRKFLRVGVRHLKCVVISGLDYQPIEASAKATPTSIDIKDISIGGLCIKSVDRIKEGTFLALEIPKIKNLDATVVTTEVTRSVFEERENLYHLGLSFRPPNTKYIKQLIEIIKTIKFSSD